MISYLVVSCPQYPDLFLFWVNDYCDPSYFGLLELFSPNCSRVGDIPVKSIANLNITNSFQKLLSLYIAHEAWLTWHNMHTKRVLSLQQMPPVWKGGWGCWSPISTLQVCFTTFFFGWNDHPCKRTQLNYYNAGAEENWTKDP